MQYLFKSTYNVRTQLKLLTWEQFHDILYLKGGLIMTKQKNNGAEKLFRQMTERAYSEVFDLPEEALLDPDYVPDEEDFDYNKDVEIKGR